MKCLLQCKNRNMKMVGFLALFQPSNATLQNQDSDFFTPLYWEVQQTRLIQYYIQSIKRCLIANNGRHLRSCEILIDIKIMDISCLSHNRFTVFWENPNQRAQDGFCIFVIFSLCYRYYFLAGSDWNLLGKTKRSCFIFNLHQP